MPPRMEQMHDEAVEQYFSMEEYQVQALIEGSNNCLDWIVFSPFVQKRIDELELCHVIWNDLDWIVLYHLKICNGIVLCHLKWFRIPTEVDIHPPNEVDPFYLLLENVAWSVTSSMCHVNLLHCQWCGHWSGLVVLVKLLYSLMNGVAESCYIVKLLY